MVTPSKKTKDFRIDVREMAMQAMLEWEAGKKSFGEISQESLKRLPEKNRPFFTELFRGTLRYRLFLDYKIKKLAERDLDEMPPPIVNLLRLAGYQLEFMTIPKPVTVDVTVNIAKKYTHAGTVGFVNGVLRHWAMDPEVPYPDDPMEFLSIRYSHPQWMVERWVKQFGKENAIRLFEWNNTPALLTARVNLSRIEEDDFAALCKNLGISVSSTGIPGAFTLESASSIEKIPGFQEGLFWIQGSSALLPVFLLDPKPGERILDLCAAPGGKTCQIAEAMKNKGEILAFDLDEDRMERVEENRRRLGFSSIRTMVGDGLSLSDFVSGVFDGVLVDAPCTGTGVFRKKVDARWKKNPEDIERFPPLQGGLLTNAGKMVKEGGRLVYATCSLEPEENEQVIERFLRENSNFILESPLPYLPSIAKSAVTKEGYLQVRPQDHEMDGFFSARLIKKS